MQEIERQKREREGKKDQVVTFITMGDIVCKYIEDLGSIAGSNMVFSHLQKQAKHIYFTFYFYILLLVASQAKKQTK